MQKPDLKDYGITEEDIEKTKINKKRLKIVSIIFMFMGLWLLEYGPKDELLFWLLIVLAVPPYGPIILYFILKGIFRFFSHPLRNSEKYFTDCDAFEKWWVRTQEIFWKSLSGRQFEHELANLYRKIGYKAEVTIASDDKGVDIWLTKNGERIPVQCKAHKKAIGPNVARELSGSMCHFKVNKAILASLSGFTKGVHEHIKNKQIELVDLRWIINQQKRIEEYD